VLVVLDSSIALFDPPIRVTEEFAMLDVISGGQLVSGLSGRVLASAFFAEADTVIETPRAQAVVPDLAHPKAQGQRPDDLEERLKFGDALNRPVAQDAAVHKLFMEVLHLLEPPSALRETGVVERVNTLAAQA
jgi:hypothetical protein